MEIFGEEKQDFPLQILMRSEVTDKTDEHNWSEDIEKRLEAIQYNQHQLLIIAINTIYI